MVGLGARNNDTEILALKSPVESDLDDTFSKIGKKKLTTTKETDSENVLEVENFESLMLSMDKSSLNGVTSDTASEGYVELGRAFTKEELFDHKR